MTEFWQQAAAAASEPIDINAAMQRLYEQLHEQARNPPPPQPCLHMEPYPGWARRQAREGRTLVSCFGCGAVLRLPRF